MYLLHKMMLKVVLFQSTLFFKKLIFFQKNCLSFKIDLIALSYFKNKYIARVNVDANASNISSNIVNSGCWTKCWMHLRAYKIYKKRKKEDKNRVERYWISLFLIKLFVQHFLVHPTKFSCWLHLSTVSSYIWFFIIALRAKHMQWSVFRTISLNFECQ